MICTREGCTTEFSRDSAYIMSKGLGGVSEKYYCSADCAFEDNHD